MQFRAGHRAQCAGLTEPVASASSVLLCGRGGPCTPSVIYLQSGVSFRTFVTGVSALSKRKLNGLNQSSDSATAKRKLHKLRKCAPFVMCGCGTSRKPAHMLLKYLF